MSLIRVRETCPDSGICPTLYRDDQRNGPGFVQGRLVTDPAVLADLNIPADEVLIEIPMSLIVDLSAEEAGL